MNRATRKAKSQKWGAKSEDARPASETAQRRVERFRSEAEARRPKPCRRRCRYTYSPSGLGQGAARTHSPRVSRSRLLAKRGPGDACVVSISRALGPGLVHLVTARARLPRRRRRHRRRTLTPPGAREGARGVASRWMAWTWSAAPLWAAPLSVSPSSAVPSSAVPLSAVLRAPARLRCRRRHRRRRQRASRAHSPPRRGRVQTARHWRSARRARCTRQGRSRHRVVRPTPRRRTRGSTCRT